MPEIIEAGDYRGKCRRVNYFAEEVLGEIIYIPEEKGTLGKLTNLMINPEVIEVKWVKTSRGKNFGGKYLTGYKLMVQVKLEEKLIYTEENQIQSVGSMSYQTIKSVQIIIPRVIGGKEVGEMVKNGRITLVAHLEDAIAMKIDSQSIYRCGLLLVEMVG